MILLPHLIVVSVSISSFVMMRKIVDCLNFLLILALEMVACDKIETCKKIDNSEFLVQRIFNKNLIFHSINNRPEIQIHPYVNRKYSFIHLIYK